jgi:hypothetical protein
VDLLSRLGNLLAAVHVQRAKPEIFLKIFVIFPILWIAENSFATNYEEITVRVEPDLSFLSFFENAKFRPQHLKSFTKL